MSNFSIQKGILMGCLYLRNLLHGIWKNHKLILMIFLLKQFARKL